MRRKYGSLVEYLPGLHMVLGSTSALQINQLNNTVKYDSISSLANQRNIKIGIEKSRGSFVLVNKTAALNTCFMPGGL